MREVVKAHQMKSAVIILSCDSAEIVFFVVNHCILLCNIGKQCKHRLDKLRTMLKVTSDQGIHYLLKECSIKTKIKKMTNAFYIP